MPDRRKYRKRSVRLKNLCAIVVYAVVLLGIVGSMLWERPQVEEESFGSLEGRFDSDITMEHNGQSMNYREFEITNYLFIGMDREELRAGGYQNGGQADFLLLLSIDRRNRTVTPVMIERDTMTPVTTYGIFGNEAGKRTMQICLAHAFSGPDVTGSENTCSAVSELMCGILIDRCVLMDLGGIALLNDAIGGVEVTLEEDMTALDPALRKGETVHLKGDLAEHFVRGRMNVSDGTNASRMQRQQTYMDAMLRKLKSMVDADEGVFTDIFDSIAGHVQSNTDRKVILAEADNYSRYEWKTLKTLPGWYREGEDGFTEFWADDTAMKDMIAEIWFR